MTSESDYHPSAVNVHPSHASNLLELIALAKKSPIIIGKQCASGIESFIEGFLFGCPKEVSNVGRDVMLAFNHWIRQRFDIRSSHGWSQIIEFHSLDEPSSLTRFWELWDQFLFESERDEP